MRLPVDGGATLARPDPIPQHLKPIERVLRLDVGGGRVIRALTDNGVTPILMKGPVITRWLYDGDVRARPYGDIDLLVDPANVLVAEGVLRGLGFVHEPFDDIPGDKPWHAHHWRDPTTAVEIDLHRTIIGTGVDPARVWELLSQVTEPFDLRGTGVSVLAEGPRCLHVALHAAQGGPRDEKAVSDLGRAVELPLAIWEQARDLALELRAEAAMAAGLRLTPRGAAIAASLALPTKIPVDVALRSSSAPPAAVGLAWLFQTSGFSQKLQLIWRKTFPPREFMDAWLPKERRGRLGLVGAYLYRFGSLAVRMPGAIRAWWKANKG